MPKYFYMYVGKEDKLMAGYTTVKIPKNLMEEIDQVIANESLGYASRSEFIKDAVRHSLMSAKVGQP